MTWSTRCSFLKGRCEGGFYSDYEVVFVPKGGDVRLGSTILFGTGVTKYSEKVYHLNCRQCRDDGRGAEAVGDHGEVGEGSLDAWVQDRLGAGVAQGRPVLVQQVHQLLADKPTKEKVRKLDLTDGKILGQWNGQWFWRDIHLT